MINEYRTISPPGREKPRHHHRSMCLPACFSSSTHPFDVLDDEEEHVRTPRSPMMPELRDRCRNLISKIGGHRRRRAASADFSYNAYSYALNFEDENTRAADEFILRSRLPVSASGSLTPPEKSTTSRHILDDVILEDEEREGWRWRMSAQENVPKSGGNVSRIGIRGRNRHSSTSADFSYEPSSYALNFEDDSSKADELGPLHDFMARLPHSPTCNSSSATPPTAKCSIAAFS